MAKQKFVFIIISLFIIFSFLSLATSYQVALNAQSQLIRLLKDNKSEVIKSRQINLQGRSQVISAIEEACK